MLAPLHSSQWACMVSPIFVTFLLMKVSGVAMLESRAMEKWGQDPTYLLYLNNTHVCLILPKGENTLEVSNERQYWL